jgi:hypothetical protein
MATKSKSPPLTLTLARGHGVGVGGITYINDTLPCQAPPSKPLYYTPKLVFVPPGRWVINPQLTIVALGQ